MDERQMLGQILLSVGCITEDQLQEGLDKQIAGDRRRIGEILVEMDACDPEDITCALANQHNIPAVDLESIEIPKEVIDRVPGEAARQYKVMPIDFDDGMLTVAMSDPLDLSTLDDLRFMFNVQVEPVLTTEQDIKQAHTKYYGVSTNDVDDMIRDIGDDIEFKPADDDPESHIAHDDAPIIKLVSMIIMNAVKARASDIHIEPMSDRVRIRYRIDGECFEVEPPPKRLQGPMIGHIKILAEMDMAEKRRPQDGRIKINLMGKDLDLRVSSLPATHGESIVMRILDRESVLFGLEQLGFHHSDKEIFESLIRKPNGIILITGPTGSGKTTTLYAALSEINTPDRKIITAENPVEYNISGINQCNVNERAGLTFQRIVRAMLRQAPNVILVGEIRDRETADIAIQAALTGHLVFSTLHTNDAPSAITRLLDIGIQPFLVASSIQAVVAQRLVRMFCPDCKEVTDPDIGKLKAAGLRDQDISSRVFYRGRGCDNCNSTGYKGRKGIFEIMVMNNQLRKMAFEKNSSNKIRQQALDDGMVDMFDDGLRKVIDGLTSIDEILSVAVKK